MSGLREQHLNWFRRTGTGMVIAGIVVGLCGTLWGVIAGGYDDVAGLRAFITPLVLVVGGAVVIITTLTLQRGHRVRLLSATLALTFVTIGHWLFWLWAFDLDTADAIHLRLLGTLSIAVVSLAMAGQLLAAHTITDAQRAFCRLLAIWTLCYAGWIIAFIWSTWMQRRDDLFGPATGVAALVTVGMLMAARAWLSPRKKSVPKESLTSKPRLRMTCPNCRGEQAHTAGLARCPHCGFVMMIEIEEPRCECGYLLYQLTGDTCPECGRPVAHTTDATRQA